MRHRMGFVLSTAGSLVLATVLAGCAGSSWQFWKTSSTREAPGEPVTATAAPAPATAAPAVATAMPASPTAGGSSEHAELADVRFRPGLVTVGKADAPVLDAIAQWLKEHPGAVVRIEGHSDDRGTPAANLAVGERRAVAVMKYLVAKGVESGRFSVVSYGSERPVCVDRTDTCRAQNRRARLLVKQR